LAVQTSKTAVTQLMRIAWRTVGAIITRVCGDIDASVDRLDGLRRIGIDEISYKRGHRYLLVVIDHDRRRLIWAAHGRDQATANRFFDELGEDRCAQLTHISADAAGWLADVIDARCPNAVRCMDAFHVVAWATEALAVVRRESVAEARRLLRQEGPGLPGRPKGQPPRPGRPSSERKRSSTPAGRYGRTRATSPPTSSNAWTGSPRPTRGCTAPTCSKKACGTCSPSRARQASKRSTAG
jgi:transposase